MEVDGRDIIIGEFRASDYGCILASFDSDGGLREESTDISVETIEEFIADNPVPVYQGQKYSSKLKPRVVLAKDICSSPDLEFFSEFECRALLRLLTGKRGYQWMKIITDEIGEDIWYRARTVTVSYEKLRGHVIGIILEMECDSQFAWSQEIVTALSVNANEPFYIYNNSDDCWNMLSPYISIIPQNSGDLEIINRSDNNRKTIISDVKKDEIIRMDSKNEILDTSRNDSGEALINMLNKFNMNWIRLVPNKNEFICNIDAKISFKYRLPIKVAFVTT